MSIYDRNKSGWIWLVRAHDHIWRDRKIPLEFRIEVCRFVHELSLRCDPTRTEESHQEALQRDQSSRA